jgi:tRNA(fMet)-specific endonuclease VapC
MKYALDTNIIIDYVNREETVMAHFREAVDNDMDMVIPVAVDFEIIRGFHHKPNKGKETAYGLVLQFCPVEDMTPAIWKRAASIWGELERTGKRIGDADTIIAAHCLVNGYTLITHNTNDFKRVNGLQLMDWPL